MRATTCDRNAMVKQRWMARGFVIAGGLFWTAVALLSDYAFKSSGGLISGPLVPIVLAAIILVMGRLQEYFTAVLLFTTAATLVMWGILVAWVFGEWILADVTLIVPMTVAGVLFLRASHMERICRLTPQTADVGA